MLSQTLKNDLITAMKAGEALKVSVLRMLLSELNYKQIEVQRELEDADVISVIQKEVKKRNEAVASFTAGGRTEQAEAEANEAKILQTYLPQMLTEEEIKSELKNIPDMAGKDFGQVMRVASPWFRGKADGAVVAKVVKEWLQSTS